MTSKDEWREQQKAKAKAHAAEVRKKRAADPRVLAMKQALKERRHLAYQEQKKQRKERAEKHAQRDQGQLRVVRPAPPSEE